MEGYIHSIETFGSVDGPGVRFVIFVQGCAMRCLFCHNADTWEMKKGTLTDSEELLKKAEKYRSYWGKEGGITVSGGEPLLQIDFLLDLFKKAKERGISTCIDTAGQPFTEEGEWFSKFEELMQYTDLLLVDVKHIDPEVHKELTGVSNENIRKMLVYLDKIHKPVWIRQVLVEGYTDNDEFLYRTRELIETLHNVEKIEVLPYHSLGAYKWKNLGIPYRLKDISSPTNKRKEEAQKILCGEIRR